MNNYKIIFFNNAHTAFSYKEGKLLWLQAIFNKIYQCHCGCRALEHDTEHYVDYKFNFPKRFNNNV